MPAPGIGAAACKALVISRDLEARELLINSLTPLAIQPEICEEVHSATRILDSHKFEAVIVDMRLGDEATLLMQELHRSPANRRAVSFAITASNGAATLATKSDSMFVLERPLSPASVSQTLRAAYGLMVRERRRYFRCPVEIPAAIRTQQNTEEISCKTVNISEGGVAVRCHTLLGSHIPRGLRFRLPGGSAQLFAETTERWRLEGGVMGLEFATLPPSQKSELQEWLAQKLEETLPESVAALFRDIAHPLDR
jgi:ActR/RegA family two-component response regulator